MGSDTLKLEFLVIESSPLWVLLPAESSFFENDTISRKTTPVVAHVSPVTVSHNDGVCSSPVGAQATPCVGEVGERESIGSGLLRLRSQHERDLFALEGQEGRE